MEEQQSTSDPKDMNLTDLSLEIKWLNVVGLAGICSISAFLEKIAIAKGNKVSDENVEVLKKKMKMLMELKHEQDKVHDFIDNMLDKLNDVVERNGHREVDLEALEDESLAKTSRKVDDEEASDFIALLLNALDEWEN